MVCSIYELEAYLAQFLQVDLFDDCAYNGLQIQGTREIKKIATAVTASEQAILHAIEKDCDALIVHHGLLLNQVSEPITGALYRKYAHIVSSGMHLLGYHLPLDAHREVGNSWPLAHSLCWTDLQPFCFVGSEAIGVMGTCDYQCPDELYKLLSSFFGVQGICVGPSRSLSKVAFVSGNGHKYFKEAIRQGVDCFITGAHDTMEWHRAFEEKAVFMSFGHHATEVLGPSLLGQHLSSMFHLEQVPIAEANPF